MTLPASAGAQGPLQWSRHLVPRAAYVLFGGAAAAIAVISLLPGLIGPSLDAAVFSVMGERLAAGQLPYLDVFDHKPPGLYLIIAAGQLLGGSLGVWKIAWIVSVVSVALTGVVVADTLRNLGWRRRAWIVAAIATAELASFPLALGGGLSETAAILPAAAAIRHVLVGCPTPDRRLGAGLLAGLASAISLQAAPVVIGVLAADAVRSSQTTTAWRRLLDAAWIGTGVGVMWSILIVLLGSAGATAAAFKAIITYNGAYRSVAGLDDGVAGEALHALLVLAPLWIPAVIGLRFSLRRTPLRAAAVGSITWLATTVAFVVMQGRLEIHYTTLLVVPLALLAPAGLRMTLSTQVVDVTRTGLVAGLMLAAVALSAVLVTTETAMALGVRSGQAQRSESVARWVQGNVSESGPVFVWGNRPELYLDIPRAPASGYIYMLPLMTPGFVTDAMVDRVRDEFVANPPALIVDAGSAAPGEAGLPPLLIQRATARLDGRNEDILAPLRDYIGAHYSLGAVVDGWPVYVLR